MNNTTPITPNNININSCSSVNESYSTIRISEFKAIIKLHNPAVAAASLAIIPADNIKETINIPAPILDSKPAVNPAKHPPIKNLRNIFF